MLKATSTAVTGVAVWAGHCPTNQEVAGSIPRSGHMPGFQAKSPFGGLEEAAW